MSYVRNKIATHTAAKNNPTPEVNASEVAAWARQMEARILANLRRKNYADAVASLLSFQSEIARSDLLGVAGVNSSFNVARNSVLEVLSEIE